MVFFFLFFAIITIGSDDMYSLFIDTHDLDLVIALYKDKQLKDKEIKESLRNHSDYTMPIIDEIIKRNNIGIHDIKEILVVNGPGSFTGVRIGVTIAKMLAYTLNIPIKSIDSITMYGVSDNDKNKKLVLIPDVKGSYGGVFENNTLIGELFYKSKAELEEYINENNINKIVENKIDFNKIIEHFESVEPTLAHLVNPIYVKVIEALNDKNL